MQPINPCFLRGLVLLPLLALMASLAGQSTQLPENGVRMIARSTGEEVRLRWAPTNWRTLDALRRNGVYLERQTVLRDGAILPEGERRQRTRLNDTLIVPAASGVFAVRSEFDRMAGIAGQVLYGETFNASTPDGGQMNFLGSGQELENRYNFALLAADQSFDVALLMGLGYVDEAVNPRETYVYTLRSPTLTPSMDTVRYNYVSINAGEVMSSPRITGLSGDFRDGQVMLQWPVSPTRDFYGSYDIERSTDGLNWRKRNANPYLPLLKTDDQEFFFYADTLAENGRPYFYRVIGRTPFGERGEPSDPIQGAGVPAAGTIGPYIESVMRNAAGGLTINWNYQGARSQVQRVDVLRAEKARGPFVSLTEGNPPLTQSYEDPEPMPSNYYKIRVTDIYGREELSFAALGMPLDETPPDAPQNARGIILKDGTVVLSWDDNPEADLMGYRVYLSNKPDSEYALASGKPERANYYTGTTTLNTLSGKLYAKVVALDFHQNNSPFSEYAILERPDTIPPTPPLFTGVRADSSGVILDWAGSQSADVDRHELYQRPEGAMEWTLVRSFPYPEAVATKDFIVDALEPDVDYDFRLDAVDRGELRASSSPARAAKIGSPLRADVGKVVATPDRRARAVNVRWSYRPDRDGLSHFLVYRARADAEPGTEAALPLTVGRLPAEAGVVERRGRARSFSFSDPSPGMNTSYRYYVRAIYADGGMSRLSSPATVDY